MCVIHVWLFVTLRTVARLLYPWRSPDKNTGVGCHALLQGIFPTQGSNSGLPHCRWILYHLRHQETKISTQETRYHGHVPAETTGSSRHWAVQASDCGSTWTRLSNMLTKVKSSCFQSLNVKKLEISIGNRKP